MVHPVNLPDGKYGPLKFTGAEMMLLASLMRTFIEAKAFITGDADQRMEERNAANLLFLKGMVLPDDPENAKEVWLAPTVDRSWLNSFLVDYLWEISHELPSDLKHVTMAEIPDRYKQAQHLAKIEMIGDEYHKRIQLHAHVLTYNDMWYMNYVSSSGRTTRWFAERGGGSRPSMSVSVMDLNDLGGVQIIV